MKKFFLIPLMTLVCSVMAWGEAYEVNSFSALKNAIEQGNYPEVKLTADDIIRSTSENSCINITRSVTIDGDNHSITGYACRATNTSNGTLIAINHNGTDSVDVIIKNLTLNDEKLRAIETRGLIRSLTLENCTIKATKSSGYQQPLTLGGNQVSTAKINITNCRIEAANYYPIITFNPIELTMTNSSTLGWCAVYFKGIDGSAGSHGSTMVATNCTFDAQNNNSGNTNSFGAFVLEDDGIDITLDNCIVDCRYHDQTGVAQQSAFLLSAWKGLTFGRLDIPMNLLPCNITIQGASTSIDGIILNDNWAYTEMQCPTTFTVYGGTFNRNIEDDFVVGTGFHVNVLPTVKDGEDIILYRVVKNAEEKEAGVLYDLNDLVAGEGIEEGNNPVSSFDLSTGTGMTLNQETTTAGYVQVSDKDNGVDPATPTTVTVGTDTQDQTLVINSGLDVQGESQVIVQAGSTLQIGEGGITTSAPENIVVEANENGAASLLLNPEVIVNNTPNLTVEMKVSQAGKDAYGDYWWHRFAMPVGELATAWTKSPNYGTYLYGWNYATNNWEQVAGGSTSMQPWKGYTLTYNEAYNEDEVVTYTFKGNLVGNTDAALTFEEEGYQFFGNSYTGYMDVLTLINQLTDGNIDKSVWMWNPGNQTYTAVPLEKLSDPVKAARLKSWQKEVAPMQTFIMRLRGASSANETVSYADAIWGNPRYGNGGSGSGAPRRRVATADEAYMEIVVTAANGQSDRVDFTVNSNYSDAFENGIDASKFMNERYINLYATVAGEDYTSVATNNIAGKTISLQTKNDLTYTISFENVETEGYVLLDKLTNNMVVIAEGNTYEFTAQPNSVVEGRFEILSRADAPTAIENTEVKANVKGIYTILGQYLGEDFDVLPAGVYVVDGVKIVK